MKQTDLEIPTVVAKEINNINFITSSFHKNVIKIV